MKGMLQEELDFGPLPAMMPWSAPEDASIQERFEAFHAANPHVYDLLARMARRARAMGRKQIGIGMMFEVLRWNYLVRTEHAEGEFKLNNNFRSRYARLLTEREPDLADAFEMRELKAP